MLTILQLIGILTIGYLSAHFLVGKLQSKFFFTSGIEYILLGVLLGSNATNVMTPQVVQQLSPFISISIGALGLFYGLELRFTDLAQIDEDSFRLVLVESFLTFILVGGICLVFFHYIIPNPKEGFHMTASALTLGATAVASAPTALQVVERHYQARGPIAAMLKFSIIFNQFLAIVIFGLIFCFLHIGQTHEIRSLTTTEWAAVNIGIGLVLGILFYLFLGREENEDKLKLGLLGIVVFSSGAAYYLNLSPIFINLVLGMMLANTSQIRNRLLHILKSVEHPFYVLVLVFAGASWNISTFVGSWPWFIPLVIIYGLFRCMGKLTGGYITFIYSEYPEKLPRRIGLGLLSQGGVAVAMAVNFQQVYQSTYTDMLVTCILFSVILFEMISPSFAKSILLDANEIRVN